MPPLSASPRVLALPWWALLRGRRALVEFRAPFLELHVGARSPLPPAEVLRAVASAPDVRGIWLRVERLGGAQAGLIAAADALAEVRAAGRVVVAELDAVGNAELLIASACDRAYARPGAQTWCVGLGTTLRFYGHALSRLGIDFDVEAVGEFKAFGETFARAFASSPNREAMRCLLDDLQAEWVSTVARHRGLDPDEVRAAVAASPMSAEALVERGLLDGVAYGDEVRAHLETLAGGRPRVVPFGAWYARARRERMVAGWIAGHAAIPVLRLTGAIVDGQGQPGLPVVPAAVVVETLRQWEEVDAVRAVVVHVNSPGGSAAASDLAWRAVSRLAARKPVVACYGDVCASGGVYLTAAATEIVCHPATITGSIGVIAGKPVLRGAMERLGVHSEDVLAGPQADVFAETAFSPGARARVRDGLESMYTTFVDRVAQGRKRPPAEVEPLARGRVWSGRRAHAHGLVDHLGGLETALSRARALAGVATSRSWDVAVAPPGSWLYRALRRRAVALVPELRWLDELPLAARALAHSPAEALALLPVEFDVR